MLESRNDHVLVSQAVVWKESLIVLWGIVTPLSAMGSCLVRTILTDRFTQCGSGGCILYWFSYDLEEMTQGLNFFKCKQI